MGLYHTVNGPCFCATTPEIHFSPGLKFLAITVWPWLDLEHDYADHDAELVLPCGQGLSHVGFK